MKRIYKYKLPSDGCMITIQEKIVKWLDVRTQDNWPHVWAIVETDVVEPVEIIAWGTGWDVPQELMECNYLGTESDCYGYVWHYFWKKVQNSSKTYTDDIIDCVDSAITYNHLDTITSLNDYITLSLSSIDSCDGAIGVMSAETAREISKKNSPIY